MAEDDAGVGGEQVQEAEFLIGELHVAPVDPDAAARGVDLHVVHADDPGSRARLGPG